MSDQTGIEWTDTTWNPVVGCSRVSRGCERCYAERMAATRLRHRPEYAGIAEMTPGGPRWTGRVQLIPERLDQPLRWRKPRRVFVNSMSDLFHEDLSIEDIALVFNVMACATTECAPHPGREHEEECWTGRPHTFQILTKRPQRMLEVIQELPAYTAQHWPGSEPLCVAMCVGAWPLPNVWLGVSIEDQRSADERIPLLLQTPAAVRFVSAEPLLGPVDLRVVPIPTTGPRELAVRQLDWVIAGGESGPGHRPMDPAWAEGLRDQCAAAGVPFFFKQMAGKSEIPKSLMVRQFPDEAVPA